MRKVSQENVKTIFLSRFFTFFFLSTPVYRPSVSTVPPAPPAGVFMIWGVYMLPGIWHVADLWLLYIPGRSDLSQVVYTNPEFIWEWGGGGGRLSHTQTVTSPEDWCGGTGSAGSPSGALIPTGCSLDSPASGGSRERNIWRTGLTRINNKSEEDIFEETLMLDDRGFSQTRPKAQACQRTRPQMWSAAICNTSTA